MIKKSVLMILIIGAVSILIIIILFILTIFSTKTEVQLLYFPKHSEELFIINERRGLNYELTAVTLSSSKKIKNLKNRGLIYSHGGALFYEQKEDTLLIYTILKASIPDDFKTKTIIKQIEISNPKYIELSNNYLEIGLNKFPSK
jgi:hypothetical protein